MSESTVLASYQIPNSCSNSDYKNCETIQRLSSALCYYSSINIIDNEKHRDNFLHFITKSYPYLLDDYTHLLDDHRDQILDINQHLIKHESLNICNNVKDCLCFSRHHGLDNNNVEHNNKAVSDPYLKFYMEILDSLHFYIFHLYHLGYRTMQTNENDDCIQENSTDAYFDADFSRISRMTTQSQHLIPPIRRFSVPNNCKFSIKTDKQYEESDDTTFLDALHQHLLSCIDIATVQNFQKFVESEEYDTESIKIDTAYNTQNSNISQCIKQQPTLNIIKDFIQSLRCMLLVFSHNNRQNN